MSEEFESTMENNYSAFWPLLILLVGLLVWIGYEDIQSNSQRSLYDQQFQKAYPTLQEAQNVRNRYLSLMNDLIKTSEKDPAAQDIVKAAISAGLIQVQQKDTNSTANPAPPADAAK